MGAKIMEWIQKLTVITELLKVLAGKGKTFLAELPVSVWDYLKQTWMLWLIVGGAAVLYGDNIARFKPVLFLLAPLAAILLVVERILDAREGWGLFPGLDLNRAFYQAMTTPLSCALVILGLCGVMVAVLLCTALILGA